ncbi:MAG: hypothetical protein JF597_48135 [Streptomyces sp.]|jgi:hypothetical protein|uniref:hypothetical protein n=1 Tax=Streptomyces sp. TaxID=1931 RepID=UPI0025F0BC66|nr:hypothetical protein [Streptomyces sp.]MBW8801049.1 hypothetical protein [Streptomyces sp.]
MPLRGRRGHLMEGACRLPYVGYIPATTAAGMEIDTVWKGGTVDRNRENDRQRVLVLDSGDEYYF